VTAAGELDYEATDAAFTQQFWGEYEESDTRSVWDGHQWRLPERTLTRGGGYGAGVSNPLVQTKAGGAALDLGFYNGGHHSWGYEGKAVHAHFSPATLGPGPGEDLAFWDDSANPDMAAGPSLLRQDGGGGGLAGGGSWIDHDQQIAGLAFKVPDWVQREHSGRAHITSQVLDSLKSADIEYLAKKQPDTIRDPNGNVGIFLWIDGKKYLVEYKWIPPVLHNPEYTLGGGLHSADEIIPGRYEFKDVYSPYSTGAIGQDPQADADSLYFSANLMLYGGLAGIAVSAPGAVVAANAYGLPGVLAWGAAEVTSAATGLPIPAPGGAARSTAKNLAETAAEQLAKSAEEMQDVAEGVADTLRNAPKEAVENLPTVTFSSRTHPELAENIRHAQAAGHPSVLTHGGDAAANRAASLEGVPNIKPLSRDEYPFASSVEGGPGAWVGHVPASQQNSQGGILSNFFRRNQIKPGDRYRVNTD